MNTLHGLLLGLGLMAAVPGAEPPEQGRNLTGQEQKEVHRLELQWARLLVTAQFEEAVRVARRVVDYRVRRQGTTHWEVSGARLNVERLQRLAGVPVRDRADVIRAVEADTESSRLQRQRRYPEAEMKLRQALTLCRKVLGEQHPETAQRYCNLALFLDARGRHGEALPLHRKALDIRLETLGEQHLDSASSYNHVATCLSRQGRSKEALPLFRKVLAVRLVVLGDRHPNTATSYNNLAFCLYDQGKYAEALLLYQKALAINRKVLGEQHPNTATSQNNVAGCLSSQGRHAKALPIYRQVLAVRRKVLGEQHPQTAESYNNVASCLSRHGRHAEALPLYQEALDIFRKVLGEQHPVTALGYNNVASCLERLGRYAEALPRYKKALAIRRKVLGEEHPETGHSYNNLASCLGSMGGDAEALTLYRQALAIFRKVLSEQHPHTATAYNNVASCLGQQGEHAEALPLLQRALVSRLRGLGEQHPATIASYNNVAGCLDNQGRHVEALALYRKALTLFRRGLGEEHPDTATGYSNLAFCLDRQGRHAEALPLSRKALAIRRKVLKEDHPLTAISYNNVASCLEGLGRHAEALPLYHKALARHLKALGEQHPSTAVCYGNLAYCLDSEGKHTEALPLHQKALAIKLEMLGERHPDTALGFSNVAACLNKMGKHAEAVPYWEKALRGADWGRSRASTSGFDRSLYRVRLVPPRSALAACLLRLGRPLEAWRHAEADLARGLLDDLLPPAESTADARRRARLGQLDRALLPLLAIEKPNAEQLERRNSLARERDTLLAEQADGTAQRIRDRVLSLPSIQKQLAADAALVFWLDIPGEHLGCVLRREGSPAWVGLPGSARQDAWGEDDASLPGRVLGTLSSGRGNATSRRRLLAQLHRQRLAPLEPHLKGVRRLLVVPAGEMAAVPVEALTQRYTISYVSSASVFARQGEQHRPLQAASLLVVADPVFTRTAPKPPAAPPHGLLILAVTPGGLAARVGVRPGDVLLEHGGKKLSTPADLKVPEGDGRVPLKLWREGKMLAGRIPAGELGVVVDKRRVAEALAAWRKRGSELLALGRGGDWQSLPGTRLEARALAALVPRATALLGSDASQQRLAELAAADKLKDYRLLHLATHGQANAALPRETALILAQDHIDDTAPARAVLAGKRPVDGRLTVGDVLAGWKLDADLVVLSACQTGLGTDTRGSEGMLGFTQALLQKGARSVVLSRWKVDDAATALLMTRFYENLLGKRKGMKSLGRAAALAEAKAWLRGLSREEATRRLAALVGGIPRGERGSIKAALPTRGPDSPEGEDRPFAAPYYWAAFVLLGDPN